MNLITKLLIIFNAIISQNTFASLVAYNSQKNLDPNILINKYLNRFNECREQRDYSKSQMDSIFLIQQMNAMFKTNFMLSIDDESVCNSNFTGFQATGEIGGPPLIAACSKDFESFDNNFCKPYNHQALAFIIAHEFSHHLLGSDPKINYENFDKKNVKSYLAVPKQIKKDISKQEDISEYMHHQIGLEEHEYVDALAAKILKSLGYGREIEHGIECITRLYPNYQFTKEFQVNRVHAITNSYIEGWNDWKDYKSLVPKNSDRPLFKFLKEKGYSKVHNRINYRIEDKKRDKHILEIFKRYPKGAFNKIHQE